MIPGSCVFLPLCGDISDISLTGYQHGGQYKILHHFREKSTDHSMGQHKAQETLRQGIFNQTSGDSIKNGNTQGGASSWGRASRPHCRLPFTRDTGEYHVLR
jgi:hypothetical protein